MASARNYSQIHAQHSTEGSSKFSGVFFFLFFIHLFLSMALVRFMVASVPVRSIFGLLLFCMVFATSPALLVQASRDMRRVLLVIAYAAGLGFIVSIFNQAPILDTLRQIVEIHFQAVFGVLLGYGLLKRMGAKKLVNSFTWVVGLSSIIAVLQAADVDMAWLAYERLQQFQTFEIEKKLQDERLRPMGLSFSSVHIGTQLCLAFAVVYIFRMISHRDESNRSFQKRTWDLVIFTILIAIASGNRSPLLGVLVFIATYMFYARPMITTLASILLIPTCLLIYFNADAIFGFFTNTGVRAFNATNQSSRGRKVLRAFGLLLLTDQPFGYGLTFKSTLHVIKFWPQLSGFDNAKTIWGNAVHNYYLNVLLKYGLLILPLALYTIKVLLKNVRFMLAFVPYAVHIFFHNSGPLQGDFFVWYFVPLFAIALNHQSRYKCSSYEGSLKGEK